FVGNAAPPIPNTPPNTAPTSQNQSLNVTEDGKATIILGGSDNETSAGLLTYKIVALPTKGVLKSNGVKVVAGQSFVGLPPSLTYEPGSEQEGGASDSFQFKVCDPQGLSSATSTVSLGITNAVADRSVVLSNGILRIGGTSGTDIITITKNSS